MDPISDHKSLIERIEHLEKENEQLKQQLEFGEINQTVKVPDSFSEIFNKAENTVRSYFTESRKSAENGEIVISGERYILLRSASLSYEFLDVIREFYSNHSPDEATRIGNNFLFDIAHVLGKKDALSFHHKMKLTDPVEKLSAGPVHFAFTGWANVEILPESNPSPDDNYFLKFYHHNSFEAEGWLSAGRKSPTPVCTMNCGYSSGWCEESFGMALTTVEIECAAAGGERCTFIMAPPHKIAEYLEKESSLNESSNYEVPVFFERKYNEDRLNDSLQQKETLLKELHHRVKNNLQVISSLLNLQKKELSDAQLKAAFNSSINRVNSIARVQDMIYSSNDLNSIDISKYFQDMIRSLYDVYKSEESNLKFEVNIEIENELFEPELAVPLGLIVNEIACNSFKYAFEENGLFYFNLKQKSKQYILTAGDNGKGIVEADKDDSLGMSLIEILCEQIDADLKINNSQSGLEYTIQFTKKAPQKCEA